MMGDTLSRTNGTRLIGLQIRTGTDNIVEEKAFLSSKDILKFAKCAAKYSVVHTSEIMTTTFFVSTDSMKAARTVTKYLGNRGPTLQITVGRPVHILHYTKDTQDSRQDLLKIWADFFLLSKCDVLILTHQSLFGYYAAHMSPQYDTSLKQLFIGDSLCGEPGHYPCYNRKNSPECDD
jgi:hypothetical protein